MSSGNTRNQVYVCVCTGTYIAKFIFFKFMDRLYKRNSLHLTPVILGLFALLWGISIGTGFLLRSEGVICVPQYFLYFDSFFACPSIGLAILIISTMCPLIAL